jgi:hypothetical protein
MKIYCCGCEKQVRTVIKDGLVVYPHRPDLKNKEFYVCESCNNFVGMNSRSGEPLGVIPTKEISSFRQTIHGLIDPLWKDGKISRSKLYKILSKKVGYEYHTADLRTIDECRNIIRIAIKLRRKIYGYGVK